ncbi:hypothetical protein [Roseomonas rosulenta]|uniref:hypothetical protein n=1 Tax=Roseomonas rosulenta TaxID=2748667 RepID=UPI0018E03D89|nr:hypothetical protein [Roseomonas rosulenta]
MGGLFRAPKPVVIAPAAAPAPAQAAVAPQQAIEETATAARVEARERTRRGLSGTIATSAAGVLGARADFVATRKSLLGE